MDPLAQRVASRFLQAIESPEALLHKAEAAVHRSTELLHMLSQAHKFWEASVPSGEFAETERAYKKIVTMLKTYEHEVTQAMGHLDDYDHMELDEVVDYPDSHERH